MKVSVPILDDKTREVINKHLDSAFPIIEGDDLDSTVKEVLNNRDIHLYLSTLLPDRYGLELGRASWWDDANLETFYGLTFTQKHPRRLALYSYEQLGIGGPRNLGLATEAFPHIKGGDEVRGIPSPEGFVKEVNRVLQDFSMYSRNLTELFEHMGETFFERLERDYKRLHPEKV